jgi:hypothetical protein
LVPNVETMFIAIKNSTYFGTNIPNIIPNRSQIHLRSFSVSAAGRAGTGSNQDPYFSPAPATIVFRQVRNPTVGPTVWNAYNGTDNVSSTSTGTCSNVYGQSSVSTNTSPLTTISGGATGFALTVACGGQQVIDFAEYESVAYPGDVLCFMANVVSNFTTSNVVIATGLTWNEDL